MFAGCSLSVCRLFDECMLRNFSILFPLFTIPFPEDYHPFAEGALEYEYRYEQEEYKKLTPQIYRLAG